MDPERVQTIKDWENYPPRNYRDLQVLLGFCNFYRRFIRGYSEITRPLTALLKGSKNGRKSGDLKQEWKGPQQQAFLNLLGTFQTAPFLRHYDPNRATRLEADALNVALGGVLSQLQEDTKQWHPIAFYSKQLKGAELNYSTPDKELMAIVKCFKHWRHYLEGSSHTIKVWSDHMNLQGFMKQPRINGRQARWLVYLTPYDFLIHHRPGSLNPADRPSRRPDYMATAQKEPGLLQNDLLAERLAGSDLTGRAGKIASLAQAEAARPEGLCNIAKCQLCEVARRALNSELPEAVLYKAARATQKGDAPSPLVDSKGQ
jgi:hypothetical protein